MSLSHSLSQAKTPQYPSIYHPISFTADVIKLLENMVITWLVWFLEKGSHFSPVQCFFRHLCYTVNALMQLEAAVFCNFALKQLVVSVFFYLEKAYDVTWRYGILKAFHSTGLGSNLALFLESFLRHSCFRLRVGTSLFYSLVQEEGIPQDSVHFLWNPLMILWSTFPNTFSAPYMLMTFLLCMRSLVQILPSTKFSWLLLVYPGGQIPMDVIFHPWRQRLCIMHIFGGAACDHNLQ